MSLLVRPARAEEASAIRDILAASFPTQAEGDLVETLTRDGDLILSLLATLDGVPVGYVGFSRMSVVADEESVPALGIAPVAVLAAYQRRGIGGRLVQSGLAAANGRGTCLVFVLGDPGYYGRFGFSTNAAAPFASPYAGPHLMAQWLSSPRAPSSGTAEYAPAFLSQPG